MKLAGWALLVGVVAAAGGVAYYERTRPPECGAPEVRSVLKTLTIKHAVAPGGAEALVDEPSSVVGLDSLITTRREGPKSFCEADLVVNLRLNARGAAELAMSPETQADRWQMRRRIAYTAALTDDRRQVWVEIPSGLR